MVVDRWPGGVEYLLWYCLVTHITRSIITTFLTINQHTCTGQSKRNQSSQKHIDIGFKLFSRDRMVHWGMYLVVWERELSVVRLWEISKGNNLNQKQSSRAHNNELTTSIFCVSHCVSVSSNSQGEFTPWSASQTATLCYGDVWLGT